MIDNIFNQMRAANGTTITYEGTDYAAMTHTVEADIINEYLPTNNADGITNAANCDPRTFNLGESIFATAEGNTLLFDGLTYRIVRVTPAIWQKAVAAYRLYCYRIVEHPTTQQDNGTRDKFLPTITY